MHRLRTWLPIPVTTTFFLELQIRDYLGAMNLSHGEITVTIYLIHGSQLTHTAQKK